MHPAQYCHKISSILIVTLAGGISYSGYGGNDSTNQRQGLLQSEQKAFPSSKFVNL
jgi:hypothetical protein